MGAAQGWFLYARQGLAIKGIWVRRPARVLAFAALDNSGHSKMRRTLIGLVGGGVLLGSVGVLGWFGMQGGWFGSAPDIGEIHGKAVPVDVIAARTSQMKAMAPAGDEALILFGDLHVHTTLSADAFLSSLPLFSGTGVHPLGDACDFARYCSALDFWASTDHAESMTPTRWQMVKDSVRACQKVSGGETSPDLVSFVGYEWTQVGLAPEEHYGHKNVIFRDLGDDKLSARPISAISAQGDSAMKRMARGLTPLIPLRDFSNRQAYFDYNKFVTEMRAAKMCDREAPSNTLPTDCMEVAATPGELVRRLFAEQKLAPLIIPHGMTWGYYTPAGTNWRKALEPAERPERFRLIELYSGHGNSEEYRAWADVNIDSAGKATCPAPTKDYLPGCWRAGELIIARCLKAGEAAATCEGRAAAARQNYVDMGIAGHVTVPGAKGPDWVDAGQCTDCFFPSFNHRAGLSVQAGLAATHFADDGAATRFNWGFIGSSDNHRARPGTGYKQNDRRQNTDARGPADETWRGFMYPSKEGEDEIPEARAYAREKLMELPGLQLVEGERQAAFLHTGGLAAVHAKGRTREAIWDALDRRETYATSGQKILLWFNAVDAKGAKVAMGGGVNAKASPTFTVKAVGAFKQKPGCPGFAKAGMDEARLTKLCSGECDNPSDERSRITRIEVVKIRPQKTKGEAIAALIQDRFAVHECAPSGDGACSFTFSDPSYATDGRDALYYVKAIQEAEPMINGDTLKCERDATGKCVKVNLCYGDYRSGKDDCLAPAEPRAWSSPIYVSYR